MRDGRASELKEAFRPYRRKSSLTDGTAGQSTIDPSTIEPETKRDRWSGLDPTTWMSRYSTVGPVPRKSRSEPAGYMSKMTQKELLDERVDDRVRTEMHKVPGWTARRIDETMKYGLATTNQTQELEDLQGVMAHAEVDHLEKSVRDRIRKFEQSQTEHTSAPTKTGWWRKSNPPVTTNIYYENLDRLELDLDLRDMLSDFRYRQWRAQLRRKSLYVPTRPWITSSPVQPTPISTGRYYSSNPFSGFQPVKPLVLPNVRAQSASEAQTSASLRGPAWTGLESQDLTRRDSMDPMDPSATGRETTTTGPAEDANSSLARTNDNISRLLQWSLKELQESGCASEIPLTALSRAMVTTRDSGQAGRYDDEEVKGDLTVLYSSLTAPEAFKDMSPIRTRHMKKGSLYLGRALREWEERDTTQASVT